MKIGDKVTMLPGGYHLMSHTCLDWKEGVIKEVSSSSGTEIQVTFPPGTIWDSSYASTLHVNIASCILSKLVPAYKSGKAKLTKEERRALNVR